VCTVALPRITRSMAETGYDRGFTFYIVAGSYGGFGWRKDGKLFRLCLGWVAVGVGLFDLENLLGTVAKHLGAEDA